jgi:hypothetical protein
MCYICRSYIIPSRRSLERHLRAESHQLLSKELKTIKVLATYVAATNKSSFSSLELAEK